MNKHKHPWPEIEVDILAGMSDRQVSDKWNIPYVTLQHHRWQKMGIKSAKQIMIEANHAPGYVQQQSPKNPFYNTAVIDLNRLSLERKLKNLSPAHQAAFLSARGPMAAVRQFVWGRYDAIIMLNHRRSCCNLGSGIARSGEGMRMAKKITRKGCAGCPNLSEIEKNFCDCYGDTIPAPPEEFECEYREDES